jgi:hypothetical protein
MMRTQVELTSGTSVCVGWVKGPVKVNDVHTREGDDRLWTITNVYSTVDVRDINGGWHNNI